MARSGRRRGRPELPPPTPTNVTPPSSSSAADGQIRRRRPAPHFPPGRMARSAGGADGNGRVRLPRRARRQNRGLSAASTPTPHRILQGVLPPACPHLLAPTTSGSALASTSAARPPPPPEAAAGSTCRPPARRSRCPRWLALAGARRASSSSTARRCGSLQRRWLHGTATSSCDPSPGGRLLIDSQIYSSPTPTKLPGATFHFPIGHISVEERINEEQEKGLAVRGFAKSDFLDGVLVAEYNDNDLDLRYCYKDDEITIIRSVLPSIDFECCFSPSDKLRQLHEYRCSLTRRVLKSSASMFV